MTQCIEKMKFDRVGGELKFSGTPAEVAEQFCFALEGLREAVRSSGARAIDYELAMMPKAGEYHAVTEIEVGVGKIRALENAWRFAFRNAEDIELEIWSRSRVQSQPHIDPTTGTRYWRACSTREVERALRRLYGDASPSRSTINRVVSRMDNRLFDILNTRGWVV